MTDLIQEIEKAIETRFIASQYVQEVYGMLPAKEWDERRDSFKAGVKFLLPLLKKVIELHNIDIDLMFSWSDECKEMRDKELLKLLGVDHAAKKSAQNYWLKRPNKNLTE